MDVKVHSLKVMGVTAVLLALTVGGASSAGAAELRVRESAVAEAGCPTVAGTWSDGETVSLRDENGLHYVKVSPRSYFEQFKSAQGGCAPGY